jgi:putative DNA primase/helicase
MAKSPNWERFIAEITATPGGVHNGKIESFPRPHLAAYLQKALGYCMTGETREQVMFMAVGRGSNGKNVLLDTFKAIAGDYAETIAPEVLMAAKFDNGAEQASPSTRKLAGARAAISSESKDGQKLDLAVVKRHTGGGFITARGLHESPFTFEITHKLVLMTNHKPKLDHMDDAIKGRLHMIPFDMKWNRPGETRPDPTLPNADKGLMQTLKDEYEGILAWLIRGAVAYAAQGLAPPAEVVAFTKDYIESQDLFAQWLLTCETCLVSEGSTAEQLHVQYQKFCTSEGEKPQIESSAAMGRKLKENGYENKRGRAGSRYGLRERMNADEVADAFSSLSNA